MATAGRQSGSVRGSLPGRRTASVNCRPIVALTPERAPTGPSFPPQPHEMPPFGPVRLRMASVTYRSNAAGAPARALETKRRTARFLYRIVGVRRAPEPAVCERPQERSQPAKGDQAIARRHLGSIPRALAISQLTLAFRSDSPGDQGRTPVIWGRTHRRATSRLLLLSVRLCRQLGQPSLPRRMPRL
jgi:hypothetical protein